MVDKSTLVHKISQDSQQHHAVSKERQQSDSHRESLKQRRHRKGPPGGIPFLVNKLKKSGFDKDTIDLIMDAWRPGTKKVYTTYLSKWAVFCLTKDVSLLNPTIPQVCKFLRTLAGWRLGFAALNAARSALSLILPNYEGKSVGKHPAVCWVIKGAYERNPPRPKYDAFWDVNKVFTLFKSWPDNKHLSLKLLSWKLAVVLLLVTSQRGQTILSLSTKHVDLGNPVVFKLHKLLKHNRLGDPLDTIVLKPFPEEDKTQNIRQDGQLLIGHIKPHRAISTVSTWTLTILQESGIDTKKFKGHSTRGASTSAARPSMQHHFVRQVL